MLVSAQTGFSQHFRYAFATLPYFHLIAGSVFAETKRSAAQPRSWREFSILLLLCWSVFSSLQEWPRSHAFFSEVCGGSANGSDYLLDSCLDWGQDLTLAANWVAAHPQAHPVYHALLTDDMAAAMPLNWMQATDLTQPGWYIVSRQRVLDPADPCHLFAKATPVRRLSNSLAVYSGMDRKE